MSTVTKPAPRRGPRRPLRTWIIAATAYVVALIFVLPYLEMLLMAVRPNDELGLAQHPELEQQHQRRDHVGGTLVEAWWCVHQPPPR